MKATDAKSAAESRTMRNATRFINRLKSIMPVESMKILSRTLDKLVSLPMQPSRRFCFIATLLAPRFLHVKYLFIAATVARSLARSQTNDFQPCAHRCAHIRVNYCLHQLHIIIAYISRCDNVSRTAGSTSASVRVQRDVKLRRSLCNRFSRPDSRSGVNVRVNGTRSLLQRAVCTVTALPRDKSNDRGEPTSRQRCALALNSKKISKSNNTVRRVSDADAKYRNIEYSNSANVSRSPPATFDRRG